MTAIAEEISQELISEINSSARCACKWRPCLLAPPCDNSPTGQDLLCDRCRKFKEMVESTQNIDWYADWAFHCHCEDSEEMEQDADDCKAWDKG